MNSDKKYLIDGLANEAKVFFNLKYADVKPYAKKYAEDGEISPDDWVVMHGSLYPYAIKMILKYKLLPVNEVEKLAI
ncbi:hypothetical protein PUF88_04015 [Lactobacillaceae bacterium L1_55_11]|nr:hypothetical protein [Lactobacillaceae bacterium L1_55_11]